MPFVANKKFHLPAEDIVPGLAPVDGCLATDRILVDGSPVGYMYRDGSGWVFTAGDETPEYLADPGHLNLVSLNVIANYDRATVPYLQAPPGLRSSDTATPSWRIRRARRVSRMSRHRLRSTRSSPSSTAIMRSPPTGFSPRRSR